MPPITFGPVGVLPKTLLATALVGLVTAGCAVQEVSVPVATPPEETGAPVSFVDEEMDALFDFPIHAYVFGPVEETTLRNAHAILVEQCMRDLGFSFTRGEESTVDPVSIKAFGPFDNYLERWHVDAEYAAEHGFSHPDELLEQDTEPPSSREKDPRIQDRGRTYDAAVSALDGFPEDTETPSQDPIPEWGCTGWAERQLDEGVHHIGVEEAQAGESGTALGVNPVADQVRHTAFEEITGDQRFLEAESVWRACMAEAGYPDEDPDTVGSGEESAVDSGDTEAAVHNVECRQESELTRTYVDVLFEVQEREIEANQPALRERFEEMETALERAIELTEG